VDIDALWIDMNEPSNFCEYPCTNLDAAATQDTLGIAARDVFSDSSHSIIKAQNWRPNAPYPISHDMKADTTASNVGYRGVSKRQAHDTGTKKGLPGRDLLNPSYKIHNEFLALSNKTADTDIIHQNGLAEYDTHNL
jgi:alpha-glucosidase